MKTGSVIRRHVVRRWRFGKIKHGSDARGMTYLCRRTAGARTSSSWNGERGDMSGASVVAGGGGLKLCLGRCGPVVSRPHQTSLAARPPCYGAAGISCYRTTAGASHRYHHGTSMGHRKCWYTQHCTPMRRIGGTSEPLPLVEERKGNLLTARLDSSTASMENDLWCSIHASGRRTHQGPPDEQTRLFSSFSPPY